MLQFQRAGWEASLNILWPTDFPFGFSDFHKKFWEWGSTIMPGEPAQDHIAIWGRGAGKSSSAETLAAYLGIMRRRKYVWYVCATQQAADDHILSIGELLINDPVKKYFPTMANRNIDKEGVKEGWRRNRLITSDGFAIDALGLDVAVRGKKIAKQRPDLIIFDDIDEQYDTPEITLKKTETIAKKILPSGTPYTVVVGAQNLITPTGIFARLADRKSTILTNSIINGPVPAIYGLKTDGNKIIDGTPSWPEGLGIDACQNIINQIGIGAFRAECQHDVHEIQGALWSRDMIIYKDRPSAFDDYNIGIDPAMSDSPRADDTGIYLSGLKDDLIYCLENHSGHYHPSIVKQIAYELWAKYQCEIHIETDNGGAWLIDGLAEIGVPQHMIVEQKSGGVSKRGRAAPLADLYKEEKVFHCDKFETLENQMVSWIPLPNAKSPDQLDAWVWATAKWLKPSVMPTRSYGFAWR